MTNDIQITDLRSLCEKRERLKLKAKYHRLGIEMHLSKGFSVGSIVKTVTNKITGDENADTKTESDTHAGVSMGAPFGVWGMAIPIVAKAVSTKISTGKSWTEILAHVARSTMKKFGIG